MTYEQMVLEVAEIISFFSDLDGGLWMLAILCELLMEMCSAQSWQAAQIIRRKMYQVAEVVFEEERGGNEELLQFAKIITEAVEESIVEGKL